MATCQVQCPACGHSTQTDPSNITEDSSFIIVDDFTEHRFNKAKVIMWFVRFAITAIKFIWPNNKSNKNKKHNNENESNSENIQLIVSEQSTITTADHNGLQINHFEQILDQIIDIFIGLTLLFFGGAFAMTIACYMAIQISGWNTIKTSCNKLIKNYYEGMDAFNKNTNAKKMLDIDNDGHISAKETITVAQRLFRGSYAEKRTVLKEFRSVFVAIDPKEVMKGISGLWTIAIAVILTLRLGFAKNVALGVSIGQVMARQVVKYAKPMVIKCFDNDTEKWGYFIIDLVCRLIGISLALTLVRVVSGFHSAIIGGQIITAYIFKYLRNNKDNYKKNMDSVQIEANASFIAVQYGLAAVGFYWQLIQRFGVHSIVLKWILLPFSICERILSYLAGY